MVAIYDTISYTSQGREEMPMASNVKTLTVRLPEDLYQQAGEVARRKQWSMNATIQEALRQLTFQDQQARLYEAFSLLGEDATEADVEFALDAQREVVDHESA
jgi:hypothetical protein